jgi:uncharacterized protein with GYD domain
MAWRDLFLASRQAILGDKGPRYWRTCEQPLGDFHARFASAKFDQRKRNAQSTHAVQPEVVVAVKRTATTQSLLPKAARQPGRWNMPLYMYQAAYTAESLAAQLKKPENRVEAVSRSICQAVGGKLVGGWYCFGDYDLAIIADVPNNEAMAAIALAVAAGGAVKSAKTTVLMTGAEAVAGMKKADAVTKVYKPAR